MDPFESFKAIGMSLGLGLLVGLQREHAESLIGGIRTFALVTMLGTLMALLAGSYGGWLVAAGALCLALLLYIANQAKLQRGMSEPGLTTEVAALLMYSIGAYLVLGDAGVAVLLGGIVAIVLQLKQPMHSFVDRMGADDIRVIMQFVLLALVILPVLPNTDYGPFGALNPHETWLMVVLIVGLSVAGYIIYKFWGERAGIVLGGALGGLVSSTATTVSYARRVGNHSVPFGPAAAVIVIASTVSVLRIIVEVSVAAAPVARQLAPPLVAMLAWMTLLSALVYRLGRNGGAPLQRPGNPAELSTALIFGGLYAAIKLGVAAARHYLGDSALYGVAALSGLTDVDAITLSTAKLVEQGQLPSDIGWRLILTAAAANLAFKAALTVVLVDRRMAWRWLLLFGTALAGAAMILWLWPAAGVDSWIDELLTASG